MLAALKAHGAHDEARSAQPHFEQASCPEDVAVVPTLELNIRASLLGCSGGGGLMLLPYLAWWALPWRGREQDDGPVFSRAVLSCQHEGETSPAPDGTQNREALSPMTGCHLMMRVSRRHPVVSVHTLRPLDPDVD
jgi:hypothetical protein